MGIHILPAYSPELNPNEYVWSYLNSSHTGRVILRTKEAFLNAVKKGLRSLQKQPDKILGFFSAEDTACACLQRFG
ncbi:transposase [Endozoicomonas sp. GU-1]|uniref:transposase n=1 Tax=Endozoicomonas sp. GU-1 TaxID=3009078 RepID=UPI003FA4910C